MFNTSHYNQLKELIEMEKCLVGFWRWQEFDEGEKEREMRMLSTTIFDVLIFSTHWAARLERRFGAE